MTEWLAMDNILYRCNDGVAIVSLNRPEALNALSDDLKEELIQVVNRALNNDEVRAIVLTGEGKAFCAGGDVKSQASRENDPVERRKIIQNMNELIKNLYKSPKPVISAVNGYAVGAGLGIALAADLIVASSNAKFSAPFIKLGLVADMGVSYLASKRIGVQRTKQLLLTGETIDAQAAEKWGLVDWVVQPEDLMPYTLKLAKQLVNAPQTALDITKSMLNNIQHLSIDAALDQELNSQTLCMLTDEHKERVKAFVESRKK